MTEAAYKYGVKNEVNLASRIEEYSLFSGIKKVPGSGNQFFAKEDLIGDTVLIQVKATKNNVYRLNPLDFRKLENHAIRFDRVPVFVVSFTKKNKDIFLLPANRSKSYESHLSFHEDPPVSPVLAVTPDQSRASYAIYSYVYRSYFLEDFI